MSDDFTDEELEAIRDIFDKASGLMTALYGEETSSNIFNKVDYRLAKRGK